MRSVQLVELAVSFFLVVTACAVITRPHYRSSRILLGVAVASFAVGVFGLVDGVRAG